MPKELIREISMDFKYRAHPTRPGSAIDEDDSGVEAAESSPAPTAPTASVLRGLRAIGGKAPAAEGGALPRPNEPGPMRRIDPETVASSVLMARAMSKEEEKQHFFSMERYRLLSSRIFDTARHTRTQVFLTASALAEEGKTLTTVNLAYAMSRARNKRILLVELDLRRPSMRRLFSLAPDPDEKLFLEARDWHDSLWSLAPNLHTLLVAHPAESPDALLHSDATRRLIDEAREEYDFVLIDSAPLLLAVDTHVLLPLVDHALLVVRADKTPIACCREALGVLGAKAMGSVLNDVKRLKHESYYKAYYG